MRRWEKSVGIGNLNWPKINNKSFRCFSYLCIVALWLGLCQPLFGQGTLAETATAVGLEEKIDSSITHPAASKATTQPEGSNELPKPATEANAIAGQQSIEKLEKVAQKLMQSMQSGEYDRADFSAAWNTIVPKNVNFSDVVNVMLKAVFEQLGKAEKLGEGRIVGPNKAVFPVQFTGGTASMTVSLDQQDKIVEWTLTPGGPVVGETSTEAAEAGQDANFPDISDFNSFQRELNRINIETRGEEAQWLGQHERKVELARAIDDLVAAQLRFIQKLAESENAEQTVRAIDLVLRQRQDRLNKLVIKLENEARQERQQQAAERRERRAPRGDRQDQTERPRPQRRITPIE